MTTVKQDMLDACLGEFRHYGFSLREPDEHTVELYHKDKRIARYNQTKLTRPILHEGCRNYLKNKEG